MRGSHRPFWMTTRKVMRTMPPAYWPAMLAANYNDCTNPRKARTDEEHDRCRKVARASLALLRRMGCRFDESECGRIRIVFPR